MEAIRADQPDQYALIYCSVVGLVLVRTVIDTCPVIKQKLIYAGYAVVDLTIAGQTWLLTLSADSVDGGLNLRIADEALPLACLIPVEYIAIFTRGTSVDISDAGAAFLLTSLAFLIFYIVYLDICEARFEALVVESVESHVGLAGGAFVDGVLASQTGWVTF
jgi:uncharacterized membrane protein YobD (UPF0266 family)